MGVQKRIPWLCSLGLGLMALTLWGTRAGADVTSDRPGSIVIWPKVIADGTRDTIITLTNTSNLAASAHCWYTQGTGTCSLTGDFCSLTSSNSCPAVVGGPPNLCVISCNTRDFDVTLTKKQPTIWRVSTGRFENLLSGSGTACTTYPTTPPSQSCPGFFGGDSDSPGPGGVPPAPDQADSPAELGGFRGELRCIQTNPTDGSPFAGDALKGEATIEGVTAASDGALLSEYNSINVISAGSNPNGDTLELNGFEGYNACPNAIDIIHYGAGASDISASSIGADCTDGSCGVSSEFTLVPCRRDFEHVIPTGFNVDFVARDEFESDFSREVAFQCWASVDLADLQFTNINGATFFRTRATSTASGLCISGDLLMHCSNAPTTACTPDDFTTVCGAGGTCAATFCSTDAQCGTGGVCGPASGILGVVEEFHSTARTEGDPSLVGSAAANTHEVDASDLTPPRQVGNGALQRVGHCRGNIPQQCFNNNDCGNTGFCRLETTTTCTSDSDCTDSGDFCDICMNDEIILSQP